MPIGERLGAEALRALCEETENALREHPLVAPFRPPQVWLSGYRDGLRIKASLWLRRGVNRRSAQSELYVLLRSHFEESLQRRSRTRRPE